MSICERIIQQNGASSFIAFVRIGCSDSLSFAKKELAEKAGYTSLLLSFEPGPNPSITTRSFVSKSPVV
jgi:hypothetical protein